MPSPAPVAVVIEDEPQIRRFVRAALEAEGWQVFEATTARSGLTEAGTRKPDLLVLDEPFEAIDPVSASNVTEILEKYVAGGGSVVMSSHSLDLIQRICDHVAVIVDGSVIAQGTVDAVRDGISLEERFKHLTQASESERGLEWLHGSSDSE